MNRRVWRVGMAVLGFGLAGNAFAGDVEEVANKIKEATENLKSFSAKMKTVTEMQQQGFSMTSTMEGTTEMLRKGGKLMSRTEMDSVTETDMGGQVTKQESSTLMINDGTHTYTLSDTAGMKSAYKAKIGDSLEDPFDTWRDTADLKVLPDESVNGHAVWVIQANPKGPAAGTQGKSLLYFHKESGQLIKMVMYTPDGKPMTTTTYTDIKINPRISADRFVFKVPDGVQVQDMSSN